MVGKSVLIYGNPVVWPNKGSKEIRHPSDLTKLLHILERPLHYQHSLGGIGK
jgi:hypothetical protein